MGMFGKKAFSFKIDKNSGRNLVKNYIGQASGPVGTKLGWAETGGILWDKATGKRIGNGPGSTAVDGSAADRYEALLTEQRLKNTAANEAYTQQLKDAAEGKGPSLANAQLKAASNRSLAQTLSAAQSGNASPLSTRNMFQLRGMQGRDLAEQAAQATIQEQTTARGLLGGQLANQANSARQDITSGYDIAKAPGDAQMIANNERARAQSAADIAKRDRDAQILGSTIETGGKILLGSDEENKQAPENEKTNVDAKSVPQPKWKKMLGGGLETFGKGFQPDPERKRSPYQSTFAEDLANARRKKTRGSESSDMMSDERAKKPSKLPPAKKEVNSFLDELEALKYEYKDPSAPGAAPGERVGITAQDLEKSTLGSKLVHNTANGKMVDTVQGFGTVLAAQAELNRRLKKLEKK